MEREPQAVAERYARRQQADRYSMLQPDVWQSVQERQRAMLRLFRERGWSTLSDLRLLEVGCGAGGNLLELLRLGFVPQNLRGVELLPERYAQARAVLPEAVILNQGDALQLELPAASHDIVFVSTVFSSLLDDAFQQRLAAALWAWVKPGGGVLWYDFTVNNPRNPDVRGVPLQRVQALFPQGHTTYRRVTLAPPVARVVTRVHPALYTWLNWPPLRTHLLCWVQKPTSL
jgi:SAM-dependent methyltransferase